VERLNSFSIITLILSLVLGILCFFYTFKTIINKKIIFKFMEESLGEAATDKSIIAMVCILLVVLGISFFAICIAIIFFSYGV
jgi:hypothetical protein